MELDDQLAALAAGELDAADARALQARVAADPALAARLARFEQLHAALTGWEAPELSDAAIGRLDTAIDAALGELGDAPLTDATPQRGAGLRALPDTDRGEDDAPIAAPVTDRGDDDVIDLVAARAARGVPRWVAGLGAAAAVLAVVGVGSSLLGVGSSSDEATSDTMADGADESAEAEMAEEGESAEESMMADSAPATGAQDTAATEMGPTRRIGLDVAEGELLSLVLAATDSVEADEQADDSAGAAQEPADAEGLATCVDEALTRDSDPDTDRMIDQLATGTYAGEPAVFVVLRSFGSETETLTVFAYDPDSCALVDSATTTP